MILIGRDAEVMDIDQKFRGMKAEYESTLMLTESRSPPRASSRGVWSCRVHLALRLLAGGLSRFPSDPKRVHTLPLPRPHLFAGVFRAFQQCLQGFSRA